MNSFVGHDNIVKSGKKQCEQYRMRQHCQQANEYDRFCFDSRKGLTMICVIKAPARWCNEIGDNKQFGIRALGACK